MKETKILILPEQKIALQKVAVNAFFYALGAIFLVLLILLVSFPNFFLLIVTRHFDKLFLPQAVAYYFFVKMLLALAGMAILVFGTYFLLNWAALRQKEIGVVLSLEGVETHWGKMSRFVNWEKMGKIALTSNPWLVKMRHKKYLLVFDVFEKAKLQKRIEEYQKNL